MCGVQPLAGLSVALTMVKLLMSVVKQQNTLSN